MYSVSIDKIEGAMMSEQDNEPLPPKKLSQSSETKIAVTIQLEELHLGAQPEPQTTAATPRYAILLSRHCCLGGNPRASGSGQE